MTKVKTTIGQGRFSGSFTVGTMGGSLSWYFPGPDRRYNGGSASLHTSEMQQFLGALDIAWSRYLELNAKAEGMTLTQDRKIENWTFGTATGGYATGVVPFSDREFSSQICIRNVAELNSLKFVVEEALRQFPRLAKLADTD